MSDTDVLAGLRVVETAALPASLAGRWLADLGAEVWKIEPPGGDPARRFPPFLGADQERSLFFDFYHAGKRSLVVDPSSAADRDRLRNLVLSADVWLDSTPPGESSPWGLDPAELRRTHTGLIHASITPFGLTGPFSGFVATDLVAQAAGGMIFTNGHPGEAPLQGFGLQAYHAGSAYLLIGIMLALLERGRTGRGQTVEVSLQEAVAGAVEEVSAAWNSERRIEIRRGSLHWSRAFITSRCRDGHVLLTTLCDWTTLVGWMMESGHGAEFTGPEWDDFPYRRQRAEDLFAALERWAHGLSARELLDGAQLRRIPFAEVRPPEAVAEDEQLRAREFFREIPAGERTMRFPGPPFVMSRTPLRTRGAAPALGNTVWPTSRLSPPGRGRAEGPGEGAPRSPHRALDGILVLDFTHVVAGPIATRILADHGATVLKVERRLTLDQGDRRGGFFGNLNRGKRSLILNMRDARGVELARRLATVSDVVIDNFSARVMGQWGLDYEGLRRLRPDVIGVGMSGFGKTGPQRDYVSFGPTLHALSGHTEIMRRPGGEPAGWGFSHSDICGGLNGAMAVLAALVHRAETGEGQFIDLSQLESVVAYMGPVLLDVLENGTHPTPVVNASQEAVGAPHGIYRSAGDDRWVAIAVLDEEAWQRFREAITEPWTADERFATTAARLDHRDDLDAIIESWTRGQRPEEVTALLQRHRIPAFTVANGEDLCALDPHLQARGYWARVPTPEATIAAVDGVPSRLSETPGFVAAPGPLHGEHTDEVLREALGLADSDIAELRSAGVVA